MAGKWVCEMLSGVCDGDQWSQINTTESSQNDYVGDLF